MDIVDALKILFTSDSVAAIITLIFGGLYVTVIRPDREELMKYRAETASKLGEILTRSEFRELVKEQVHVEHYDQAEKIIAGISESMTELFDKLKLEEIRQLEVLVDKLNEALMEQDKRYESLLSEISAAAIHTEAIYNIVSQVIKQLEEKGYIKDIATEMPQTLGNISKELNAYLLFIQQMQNKAGSTKLDRILGKR